MKKKCFPDEQIVAIIREAETGDKTIEEICRQHKISVPTSYLWRRRFRSLQENEVKKVRDMEKKNARLKRILAERNIELNVIRDFLIISSNGCWPSPGSAFFSPPGSLPAKILHHPSDQPQFPGVPTSEE